MIDDIHSKGDLQWTDEFARFLDQLRVLTYSFATAIDEFLQCVGVLKLMVENAQAQDEVLTVDMTPTLYSLATFINSFNQFDLVYVMEGVQGNPSYSTDTLVTYFYRLAFGAEGGAGITDIGLALALGSGLFLFLAMSTVVILRYFDRKAAAL